jgi:signal transduction histidine kinase
MPVSDADFQGFIRQIDDLRHEINNPLMGILGHIELLLADRELPDGIRKRAETIQQEARKIRDTVEEMGQVVRKFRD